MQDPSRGGAQGSAPELSCALRTGLGAARGGWRGGAVGVERSWGATVKAKLAAGVEAAGWQAGSPCALVGGKPVRAQEGTYCQE